MVVLLNYVVEFKEKNVLHEFNCAQLEWKQARKSAVELAVMLKSINELPLTYQGIQLYLEYQINREEISKHYIINGKQMTSEETLTALSIEHEIIIAAGNTFDVMAGYANGKNYNAVNEQYVVLCYFSR